MAEVTAMHAVLEVKDEKRPPVFPVETAMRMVAENAPSTTFVGDPLPLAMDPDKSGLTYTLEGKDTAFFELFVADPDTDDEHITTRIVVSVHAEAEDLNHEAEGRNGMYEVVLKVTDNTDLEDTLMVTITVTDRNEAPSMPVATKDAPAPDPTPANNAPEFPAATDTREVAENHGPRVCPSATRSWPRTPTTTH